MKVEVLNTNTQKINFTRLGSERERNGEKEGNREREREKREREREGKRVWVC